MNKGTLVLLLLISLRSVAVYGGGPAFSYKGHQAIECAAIDLLKHAPNGSHMLASLISWGFLEDSTTAYSQYSDLSMERQFAQNRQMFHFMASDGDVLNAAGQNTPASRQNALLLNAFPACIKMMYYFFREIMYCPTGARDAGRGTYVLMHIIADSYSTEHAIRDTSTEEVVTIKGWRASRPFWPKSAMTAGMNGDRHLLLHGVKHAGGDKNFIDSTTGKLSFTASRAAEAIKCFLIALYQSHEAPEKSDSLVCDFFLNHFRPYRSTVTGHSFSIPNGDSSALITYSYAADYLDEKTWQNGLFKYDRYPQFVFLGTAQTGLFRDRFLQAYGVEVSYYRSPGAADRDKALLRLLPYGAGMELSKLVIPGDPRNFMSSVRGKLFFTTLVGVPDIAAFFNPYVGVSAYPFSSISHFSSLYGFDLAWNIGDDFYARQKATKTIRLACGYAHENTGLYHKGTFRIKLGLNTWHGRRVNKNCPARRSA